ncbi:MAG TPA: MerR family transcriptional regulator [Dehalococcoidia bacterium]|nr:MerR family transcriptional regulator [Dehalococcoidia bacterium]
MIRIGDFSRLSRVSVKTLRYYDELGLIKPVRVDEFTGYRYYDHDQYVRLNRILALKDLGFSLEQIGHLLEAGLSSSQMRGMLELRRAEIEQRVGEERGRLTRIEAWLSQLGREDVMPEYEVVVKRVEAVKVASVRGVVPTPPEQGLLWAKLAPHLAKHSVQMSLPCIALYDDAGPREQDWDIEVCQPIKGELPSAADVTVRDLEVVETMATVVHRGPWLTVSDAYAALGKWVEDNGYCVDGPCREVILNAVEEKDPARVAAGQGASQTDPATVVEIQFPVAKG